jgi:hypothetical protein
MVKTIKGAIGATPGAPVLATPMNREDRAAIAGKCGMRTIRIAGGRGEDGANYAAF